MPERLRRLDYAFKRLPIYFVTACAHERRSILNIRDLHPKGYLVGRVTISWRNP